MPPPPVFGTHRHIALIYDGPDGNRAALAAFVREGLERGHLCLCVHHESTEEQLLDRLAQASIDAPSAAAQGTLGFAASSDTFLLNGRFDPTSMVEALTAQVRAAQEHGLEGLFVAGEMSWALGRNPGAELLFDYEERCSAFFREKPAVSLCQYDRRLFDSNALRQVLLTHPWVLIDGRLCRNFHHVPSGEPMEVALELPLSVDDVLADLVVRDAAERMVASATLAIEGSAVDHIGPEEASRLAKIYSELVLFKSQVLAQSEKRLSPTRAMRLQSPSDTAILQLRGELLALKQRLDYWQDTVRRLVGLDYDAESQRVRFGTRSVQLSRRESQLIAALISQNGRSLAARELLWRAWGGNHLAEAQVRTYIVQLRKKLAALELPAALVNEPGMGYSLRFDAQRTTQGGERAPVSEISRAD